MNKQNEKSEFFIKRVEIEDLIRKEYQKNPKAVYHEKENPDASYHEIKNNLIQTRPEFATDTMFHGLYPIIHGLIKTESIIKQYS